MSTSSSDGVGRRGGLAAHRLAPVARQLDLEALEAQDPLERLAHGGLVVDDQDAHGAHDGERPT